MMSNAEKLVTLDALNSLNDLSEEERQVALEILKQYSQQGESELFDKLKYADFDEIPVDIETFMHTDKYLGKALIDPDGRFTIFPYWEKCLKDIFPDNLTTKYNNIVFTGAIGLGKAQPLDSLVLTENGFKRMGDITLNDKAYGNDGKLHNIIGIFPQGKKKICKVSFTDDTSTLCCEDHLWTVYNIKTKATTTLATKDLIENRNLHQCSSKTNTAPRHRYKIPITAPINFSKKEIPIEAYTFGVIIGLKNKEKNIIKLPNEIQNKIDLSLVYNNINIEKIPNDYLHSNVEDRITLLQGILDAGGCINTKGSNISFATPNEQIKNDFIFLIQSLGGTCSITIRREEYRIGIRLPKDICPFTLKEKTSRLSEKALEPFRYITSIEYVEDDECQCIVLDSKEHLYLTNDFIVTHNSTIAVICLLYMLYRLLCLKDPYLYYGLQPIDKITISLMNITLENAKGVALDKLNQMILASDWFLKHGTMGGETNLIYRPEKHIEFIVASSNNQIIGRALFANFSDEANFALVNNPEKQKERMLKLITQIDARMKSRFMRGTYLPTLNILASSKDTEQSFLEAYIATKQATESKNTLIVDEPQWVVDSRKDSPEKFWVGIGNKFLANELLPFNITEEELDEYRAKGYDLWQVPIGYLDTFQQNLDEAICSIIGIATASSLKYISGEKLNQAKTDTYRNPFNKDIIEVGNAPDDYLQYANFFDMSVVSQEDLTKPLFVHLDMSTTGDKTGIAGVWITGRERNIKQQSPPALTDGTNAATLETTTFDENGIMNDLHYKLAFSVSVKAPKGAQVSFAKNRNFIRWLRDQGFAIKCVSMDTFQSASTAQDLANDGFKTKIISVDRLTKDANGKPLCLPYHFLKTAIYERRITIYQKCDLLTNELIGLERKSDGHIDHTKQGINSKDQSDGCAGALWAASQFSEEYSYQYGDNLTASLDANTTNDVYKKQQMIADFEAELAKIGMDYDKAKDIANKRTKQEQEEWEYYKDISDGIIII